MRPLTILALACAAACLAAQPAAAGPRMYVGFLDDVSFRWGPHRAQSFDQAAGAHASVVRTIVRWSDVARARPARPADSWDSAYRFDDLDEFVRRAQQHGMEVLLTIWGTPAWANDDAGPNVPPIAAADFRDFAFALGDRYSGRHAGYPFARFYSIWNEPNTPRFLQADDAPAAYAELVAAGLVGIRAASPDALVALGETAARHAPAVFVDAVARARPDLRFDAWAHHPYPPSARGGPTARAAWPDVGLSELGRFGASLDDAFGRPDLPLWITEYGESTSAVTSATQARDVATAVALAGAVDRTAMFVWLMLRDHAGEPWQSGLVGKRAFSVFRSVAERVDARNARVEFDPRVRTHLVRVPALELRWRNPAREWVATSYTVRACGRLVASGRRSGVIDASGWVPVRVALRPRRLRSYRLDVSIQDVHGFRVSRTLELVRAGAAAGSDRGCGSY